ncbi:hypothetical protein FRC07_013328, partial [Ceratobasidium sp. 392]
MASIDDPDMEIDVDEEMEELDEEVEEVEMDIGEDLRLAPAVPPVDKSYGQPRLDRLPYPVLYKILICAADLRATLAFRITCKALRKFVAETPDIWVDHVKQYRHVASLPLPPNPVIIPRILEPAYQEEILRTAFILNNKWNNPAFRALPASRKLGSHWSAYEILFVPDSVGRYFLTVSRADVQLWTLEPDSVPRMCGRIFPRENVTLGERERILNVLVSRPTPQYPGTGRSMVAYAAIQFTLQGSSRLRTEIYQLHLNRPERIDFGPGFGLCGIHMTEGSLVGFTDFVLAYALGDAAQTILLCNWITRQATRLVTPVREWEVRWQHQSCRAVTIGHDIIIVVRDSTAEVYPRAGFTFVDPDQWPRPTRHGVVEGNFEYLPTIYATDIAVFPCSFNKTPKIHIHQPHAAVSVSEGHHIELC